MGGSTTGGGIGREEDGQANECSGNPEPVPAIRDNQSDMAVFSRKGSRVVKERRQQKERQKQAQEATNMAGTALGNLMGVKEDEGDSAAAAPGEEEAMKSGNKFSEHMKKNEGA